LTKFNITVYTKNCYCLVCTRKNYQYFA